MARAEVSQSLEIVPHLSDIPAWRVDFAAAQESKADAVLGCITSIENLEGMFDDRSELRESLRSTANLLVTELENLHSHAKRIRKGRT